MRHHDASNPIGVRLRAHMHQCGLSSTELARRAEVKTSFVYDVLSGKSANPSPLKLARLAQAMGVSLSTLVEPHNTPAPFSPRNKTQDHVALAYVAFQLAGSNEELAPHMVPLGTHPFNAQWLAQNLASAHHQLRIIDVAEHGMAPTLQYGDKAMLDLAQTHLHPEGIFMLFDGNALIIRRVSACTKHPACLRLQADNPDYPDYERSASDVYMIGRIVWFSRTL